MPPAVVTVTGTAPLPAGAVTVSEVSVLAVMAAGAVPKRTELAPARWRPVIVTRVPPAVDPWSGITVVAMTLTLPDALSVT